MLIIKKSCVKNAVCKRITSECKLGTWPSFSTTPTVPLSKALELKLLQWDPTAGGCGLTRKLPAWHVCNFIRAKKIFAGGEHMWIYLLIQLLTGISLFWSQERLWLNTHQCSGGIWCASSQMSLCLHFRCQSKTIDRNMPSVFLQHVFSTFVSVSYISQRAFWQTKKVPELVAVTSGLHV